MGRMKDFAIQQQERSLCITPQTVASKDRADYERRAELTSILSGCFDGCRSMRRSEYRDVDVVIELRAHECDGDRFFMATYTPLGLVIAGDVETFTSPICDSLDESFDVAMRGYDDILFAGDLVSLQS